MIYKIKKWFDLFIDWVCVLMLGAMILIVFYQVIARRLLAAQPIWTGEISRFLMVWSIFLGSAIAFREKEHLCVDFFVGLFPKSIQKALAVAVDVLLLIILGITAFYGFQLTAFVFGQKSPAVAMSMAVPYSAVPVGCICMMLEILWNLTFGARKRAKDSGNAEEKEKEVV